MVGLGARTRPWIAPAAVMLLALALRATAAVEVADSPYHRYLVLDAATYSRIALAGDPPEPFWQPPLYPWFLRGVYALAGGAAPGAVRAVQALLGALTAAFALQLARRLGAGRWAPAAGAGAALCAPLINADLELLPAGLGAFLLTGWLLLLAGREPQRDAPSRAGAVRAGVAGLLLGAMVLLLPTMALPGVAAAVWLARRSGWRRAVLFALLAALPVAAVAARNARFERGLVPVSWNGGINLWIGNNPDYPRSTGIRPGIDWTHLVERPRCEGRARTRADESAFFTRAALRHVSVAPLRAARDLAWKAAAAVSAFEIGRNRDEYAVRDESLILRVLSWPVGFPGLVLFPAAAVACAALLRRRGAGGRAAANAAALVLACALGVLLASVIFFPAARYRVPALPVLLALAAAGLPRARVRDLPAGLAVLALGFVPHGVPPIPRSETFYEIAINLEQDGKTRDAVALYRRALELAPDDPDVHLALGLALARTGATGEGRMHLERVLELRPDADVAWQGLAGWWRDAGHHRRAVEYLERAVAVNPCNRRAAAQLAQLSMDAGDLARARAALDEAVRRYPRRDAEVDAARARLARLESGRAPGSANR